MTSRKRKTKPISASFSSYDFVVCQSDNFKEKRRVSLVLKPSATASEIDLVFFDDDEFNMDYVDVTSMSYHVHLPIHMLNDILYLLKIGKNRSLEFAFTNDQMKRITHFVLRSVDNDGLVPHNDRRPEARHSQKRPNQAL
jgi:hypothetical protein